MNAINTETFCKKCDEPAKSDFCQSCKEKKEFMIEARGDGRNWDSDYVGTESYSLADAQEFVAALESRSETDYPESECHLNPDGLSWRGWEFRILTCGDDGFYVIEV